MLKKNRLKYFDTLSKKSVGYMDDKVEHHTGSLFIQGNNGRKVRFFHRLLFQSK